MYTVRTSRQRSCNQRVGCLLLNLISPVCGQKRRDLAPLSYISLMDLTLKGNRLQSHTYEVIDRYGWSKMINSSSKMQGFFKHEPLVAAAAAASSGKIRDCDCGL